MSKSQNALNKIEIATAIINLCSLLFAFTALLFYKLDVYYFDDLFLITLAIISDAVMLLHMFCATFSDFAFKDKRNLKLIWGLALVLALIGFLLFSGVIRMYSIVPYLIGLFVFLFGAFLILSIFYSKGKRLRGLYVFALMIPVIYAPVISLIIFAVDAPQMLFFYITIFTLLFFPFTIADLIASSKQHRSL